MGSRPVVPDSAHPGRGTVRDIALLAPSSGQGDRGAAPREKHLGSVATGPSRENRPAPSFALLPPRDPATRDVLPADIVPKPAPRRWFRAQPEKYRDLIDHLFGIESLIGLRIMGSHDLGRQVVGRCAGPDLRHAIGCHFGDKRTDFLRRLTRPAVEWAWHPSRQRHEGRQVQNRLAALILAEQSEHPCGGLMLDRNGKERPKDHIGRDMAGHRFDINGRAG
jgi:hypothetical protein